MKLKVLVGLVLVCTLNVGCAGFVVDGEEPEPTAVEKVVAPADDAIVAKSDAPPVVAGASTPGEDEVQTSFPPQVPNAISTEAIHPYKRDATEPKSVEVQMIKPNGQPTVTDSADPNMLGNGGVGSVVLMSKKEAAKTAPSKSAVVKAEVTKDVPLVPIAMGTAAATAAAAAGVTIPAGVPAEKALGWLKNGNTRFVKGTVRRDGQSAKDRKRVAIKQTPHAVVLSCSDSLAAPELIFDQKLGEIGVVRTADGSVSDLAALSVEQIVKQGAHLVVVLNYSGCGGSSQSDAAQNFAAKSALLDSLIKSGQVTIKSANYDQDNGRVTF